MRSLDDIKPELEGLIREYKRCVKGNDVVRFVLCNAFKMFWLILEINTIIGDKNGRT